MKKRAMSLLLCLIMVVTLLGNVIPAYAQEAEPPAIAAEETTPEVTEDVALLESSPETEPSGEPEEVPEAMPPAVEETVSLEEPPAEETGEAPATASPDTSEADTPKTTEEQPGTASPVEATPAAEEPEVPAPANALMDAPEVDGIFIDEEHFPGKLFREWLLGQRENDPANPNVFGSDDGILTEKERAKVTELRFQYNVNTGNPPPESGLDLTGIEYFPNLETLITQHIEITNQLDLSQNTKLKLISLDEAANITYELDLSNQGELEKLTLSGNTIPSLDLSNNPKLTYLGLDADITKEGEGTGLISELDLSNNPALKEIHIDGLSLTSLDLSNNKELTYIDIDGNNLTSLDVSMLPELEYLFVESNELREIDVTKNPKLKRLAISGNADISSLDISQNPDLTDLHAQQTSLFFLDAKNNQKLEILFLDQNPLLGYEIVDGGTSLPITYNRFLDVVTVRATPDGTVDLSQLVPELDGSRISKLTGADKIEGTTLYGVKNGMDVTYNYRTRTAGDGSSNGMLARIHIVSEEPAAGAHTVNYEFKNLPAYRSLPQRVKDLLPAPQTDVADGTVVTPPELAVTQVKDLSGIWHFQGWDKTTATVNGADVTFTGTWNLAQYKTFFASYNFVPSTASMNKGHTTLPQEVVDLIPDAMEGLTDGQVITHPTPAKTEVAAEGGNWVFAGWPLGNTATVQNGNILTVGEWNFVEGPDKPTMKFTVTFKFVSLTNGTDGNPKELPQEVLDLLPAPITDLEAGTNVTYPTLAKTEIPVEGGKWVFTGWPGGTGITITGSVLEVGGWRFDKGSTPVEVAKRVELNVHTLVDGNRGFATKDMLEQMNPVLRSDDGQEIKPVRIADNDFTFEFENVPAGEYTLSFSYPSGYRFASGKVGSDMFGDYLDTGAKVTVTAGNVVNQFYTRLEKTPDEPTPPVEVGKLVQLNIHRYVGEGYTGTAYKKVAEKMNPKLTNEAGEALAPVLRENGFTFDWTDIPAGEYTLTFDTPAGWQFRAGQTHSGKAYLNSGEKITVRATTTEQDFYTQLEQIPDGPNPPVEVAKRVQLNVHTLVDGKKDFATKDMLEQMNPVLRSDDGQEVKPVRIADNDFTFEFENVPAGEYTLAFSYPAGYRFAPGKVGSDMFGDYLDTGTKVTVIAGNVVNQFYTRLEKTPDGPNPPVDNVGNLTVTKTVSGFGSDQSKAFTFTVTLNDTPITGEYGDMTFTNGVATFTLKHGESKTATGIPAGVSYTVEESDNDGYTVTKTNETGTIQTGVTATAAFENYKGSSGGGGGGDDTSDPEGDVKITKTVTGNKAPAENIGYEFKIWVKSSGGSAVSEKVSYKLVKADGTTENGSLTIGKDGYSFSLKNGESMTFSRIDSDRNVEVREITTGSFTTTAKGLTDGICEISSNTTKTVAFVNDYGNASSGNNDPDDPTPTDPKPTAPTTTDPKPSEPTTTNPQPTNPNPPERPLDKVPQTGDNSNMGLWTELACLSLFGMVSLLFSKKRFGSHNSK